MIDLKTLDDKTKAGIVCLYYAQLSSDDESYKKACYKNLRILSEKYAIKYATLTHTKDLFDAQFDNGRRGWYQKPIAEQNKGLNEIYLKYKDIPLGDMKKTVQIIIKEAKEIGETYLSIKTKNEITVNSILSKTSDVEFEGLNILRTSIVKGKIVFIVLGGDRPKWETGLVGIGIISNEPYALGYDKNNRNNFKIKVDIKLLMERPIKREDLLSYRETYGIIGIAPMIKNEPNQAISQIEEKSAIALMRAMLELSPSIDLDLKSILSKSTYERIRGATTKFISVEVDFGEEELTGDDDIEDEESTEVEQFPIYTKDDFLKEVFISEENYDIIYQLLNYKKNIILEGPPGVGKTFMAKRLAYSILGCKNDSLIKMVQFHQSYSYEDFIMGFRPTDAGFELSSGPFYDFCLKASLDNKKHFFIIDEINRGNLSKIFGELLMLIESDKRNERINLLYKNEEFGVPDNVYIIGMMNTADRSLAIIDYALRRRFSFYPMMPGFDSEGFNNIMELAKGSKMKSVIDVIKNLNEYICIDESLGDGFQIGHSYFCSFEEVTNDQLKMIVEYEIVPLIKEYWFDEYEKITLWSEKLRGALND